MKILILISALLCSVVMLSSCNGEEPFNPFVDPNVTEWIPSTTVSIAETLPVKENKVVINKSSKSPAVTESQEKNETTETETTESTETESTQATTQKPTQISSQSTTATQNTITTQIFTEKLTEAPEPHTQGVLNPNGHIPVTTVIGNTTQDDLNFVWKSQTLSLNENIEDVFRKIGEDNSSQMLSDTEMSYDYDDFILYTKTDSNDVEHLMKIEILSEDISTQKGISCGDYASSLRKYYGNPITQTTNTKHYGTTTKQLIFTYENNEITGITYEYNP